MNKKLIILYKNDTEVPLKLKLKGKIVWNKGIVYCPIIPNMIKNKK